MKKILFLSSLTFSLTVFTLSCSSDDDANSNCESCTSELGNEFKICNNGDGTYDGFINDELTGTIEESELEGLSPKIFVELGCENDVEDTTF